MNQDNAAIGVYLLIGLVLGAMLYGYIVYQGPLSHAEAFYASSYIIESAREFQTVLEESQDRPTAVMFSSETCPVCKAMEPYWRRLASAEGLPVDFWILMLNNDTVRVFLENNVTETPTFILYVDGVEKARHVGAFTGGNITTIMLEWAIAGVHGQASYTRSGDTTPIESGHAQTLGVLTALLLGFLAALSPCVFPMLAAYASTIASQGTVARTRAAIAAFTAAMLGAAGIGLIFLLLGNAAAGLGEVLTLAAGVAVTAAGVLGVLGVPIHLSLPASSGRGIVGFSLLYGVLAVQCSLPLVLGALLLVAGAGAGGLLPLVGFTLGIAVPVGAVVLLAGRWSKLSMLSSTSIVRYGYMLVALSGAVLLAYTMGVVSL